MTNVDQFASVFRAAARELFRLEPFEVASAMVVTDLDGPGADDFARKVRDFLRVMDGKDAVEWRVLTGGELGGTGALLEWVESEAPDLIVTYRNLHSRAWRFPHSLGEYLDVLTQRTAAPVMVLPHPESDFALAHTIKDANRVMAITDHLAGDHRLVNCAARFTESQGTLFLMHIQDTPAFERFMQAIAKIPSIDTDDAREKIARQLLKDPEGYIRSCREILAEARPGLAVESVVCFGNRLDEYRKHIEDERVDLLVLNTKDEDQLAMHGLAYPLAVELRQVPLLLL